jgi:hypothetical protein
VVASCDGSGVDAKAPQPLYNFAHHAVREESHLPRAPHPSAPTVARPPAARCPGKEPAVAGSECTVGTRVGATVGRGGGAPPCPRPPHPPPPPRPPRARRGRRGPARRRPPACRPRACSPEPQGPLPSPRLRPRPRPRPPRTTGLPRCRFRSRRQPRGATPRPCAPRPWRCGRRARPWGGTRPPAQTEPARNWSHSNGTCTAAPAARL